MIVDVGTEQITEQSEAMILTEQDEIEEDIVGIELLKLWLSSSGLSELLSGLIAAKQIAKLVIES